MPKPSNLPNIKSDLLKACNPEKAAFFPRFFKAGPGEYAEGDKFLGVTVPDQRVIAKRYYGTVSLQETLELLTSEWHEHRLTALLILVLKFQKGNEAEKASVYKAYMNHRQYVNNWDLVDSSAPYIVGAWLLDKDRLVLHELIRSDTLWDRRIGMIATLWFIRNNDFGETLVLAEQLLNDRHDLMHKAVGWALREVGKRAPELLRNFLDRHAAHMPRTALRYAIERLPGRERQLYLSLKKETL